MASADPLSPSGLFAHVEDAPEFHVPRFFTSPEAGGHLKIPQPFKLDEPLFEMNTPYPILNKLIQPLDLELTKFMLIEVLIAVVIGASFIILAQRIRGGANVRGKLWNLLEVFLLFIRDQIARPCIGRHDGDRFVPFLWTMFMFVLGCNLTGMIPWLGSPTGALATTSALAFVTFAVVIGSGVQKMGVVGFLGAQVPHMDLPLPIAVVLKPGIWLIEVAGLMIKHVVLAIRLLANMMAGHVILAVLLAFIAVSAEAGNLFLAGGVTVASVAGATAIGLLELFVAFLQAYIFTFLSALFIGAAVHPH